MTNQTIDLNALPLGNHLQRVNVDFVEKMREEMNRLLSTAGAKALEYVLDTSKVDSRDQALNLKAQSGGVEAALDTYQSCVRYQESYLAFLQSTFKRLESYRDSRLSDAQSAALKAVTATSDKEADLTLDARLAHSRYEGARFVFEQFQHMFQEVGARIEREAAAGTASQ